MSMLVEECLYASIKASPTFSAIPVRPNVAIATDVTPYVVYSKISTQRVKSLLGDSGLANSIFQIDVYARDGLQAANLSAAIRQAILTVPQLGAVHRDEASLYETDTKLYRYRQDFSFWYND